MLQTRGFATLLLTLLGCAVATAQTKPEDIEFKKRSESVELQVKADPLNWPKAEEEAKALLKDYPTRFESYLYMMSLCWQAELGGKRDIERKTASDLTAFKGPSPSETPDWAGNPVAWAKGAIDRLDLEGQPVKFQLTALDGRKINLESMRGKVIVIDFWATWCPPCLAALPGLKAAYERYHNRGLEVIGISWDLDQSKLAKFVADQGMPWPQYFEGSHRKFAEEFGIGGIPYMFLIDKEGKLRMATAFPDNTEFTAQLSKLLDE